MSLVFDIQGGVTAAFEAIDPLCREITLHKAGNRAFDYGTQLYNETVSTETIRAFVQEGDAGALQDGSRLVDHGLEYLVTVYIPRRLSGVDKVDIGSGPKAFRIREVSDFLTVIDVDT